MVGRGRKRTHTLIIKSRMKFPVLWSGLCCNTVKCSKILAHIKLLYNPRVNKVFSSLTSLHKDKQTGGGYQVPEPEARVGEFRSTCEKSQDPSYFLHFLFSL